MNKYAEDAHTKMLRISSNATHNAANRESQEALVYAVLALVEELQGIKKLLQQEQNWKALV